MFRIVIALRKKNETVPFPEGRFLSFPTGKPGKLRI